MAVGYGFLEKHQVKCPKNNLNLRTKTEHVSVQYMSGFWARYIYCMQSEAGYIPLHRFQL